ncbi:hypothetical protein HDK64DRAFT_312750 [Phyllosticta capitalensis]
MDDNDFSAPMTTEPDSTGLSSSHFARLPRELRDMVYEYIIELGKNEVFRVGYYAVDLVFRHPGHQAGKLETRRINNALSAMSTCKQLCKEVQEFIFDRFAVEAYFHQEHRLYSSPFDLLHTARELKISIDVVHHPNYNQPPISLNKPQKEIYSIVHDWTCRRKGTLLESVFDGEAPFRSGQEPNSTTPQVTPHKLWSRVVASPSAESAQAPEPIDLEQIYPHRLWCHENPPHDVPINPHCKSLLDKLAEGHRLKVLEIDFAIGSFSQEFSRCRNVPYDSRMGMYYMYLRTEVTRSDFGVSKYLDLISRFSSVPKVLVEFGLPRTRGLLWPYWNDFQWTNEYDQAIIRNFLRRAIEDTDEARSLINYPPDSDLGNEKSFDQSFPRLPPSVAAETVAVFKPIKPLDLRDDRVWLYKCRNTRYRLHNDPNILIWPPMRENTYDAPDDLWIMENERVYQSGASQFSSNSEDQEAQFGEDYEVSGDSEAGEAPSDDGDDDAMGDVNDQQDPEALEPSNAPSEEHLSLPATPRDSIHDDAASQHEHSVFEYPDSEDGEDVEYSHWTADDLRKLELYYKIGFSRKGYSFVFQDSDDEED